MSLSCRLSFALLPATFTLVLSSISLAGQQNDPSKGTIERITGHGRALEGNLEGDSSDRPVIVNLPPSYAKETARRYPVLYYLHGYTATAEAYAKVLALPGSALEIYDGDHGNRVGERFVSKVLPFFSQYLGLR